MNELLDDGSLSPAQIQEIAKNINLKVKFYLIHDMPKIDSLPNGNYIILITPNKNVYSGHFVCMKIFGNKNNKKRPEGSVRIARAGRLRQSDKIISYFDSYGISPPKKISNTHKTILYNIVQIQNLAMSHCGQYCLSFLKVVDKVKNIQEFLKKSREYTGLFNNFAISM